MGTTMISALTKLLIQTNEIRIIDTATHAIAWLVRDGELHTILLSAPLDRRADMERIIEEIKNEPLETPSDSQVIPST